MISHALYKGNLVAASFGGGYGAQCRTIHGLSGGCDENRQGIPIRGYIRGAVRHEREGVGLPYDGSRTSMSIDDSMWA